jgi:hypothetical protein
MTNILRGLDEVQNSRRLVVSGMIRRMIKSLSEFGIMTTTSMTIRKRTMNDEKGKRRRPLRSPARLSHAEGSSVRNDECSPIFPPVFTVSNTLGHQSSRSIAIRPTVQLFADERLRRNSADADSFFSAATAESRFSILCGRADLGSRRPQIISEERRARPRLFFPFQDLGSMIPAKRKVLLADSRRSFSDHMTE